MTTDDSSGPGDVAPVYVPVTFDMGAYIDLTCAQRALELLG